MAVWPFRRRSRSPARRDSLPAFGVTSTQIVAEGANARRPRREGERERAGTAPVPIPGHRRSRRDGPARPAHRQAKRGSPSHPEPHRAFSYSPSGAERLSVGERPPVPPMPMDYQHDAADVTRLPTLHNKRSAQDGPRRKSTKKRKDAHSREAEIKAMSEFMPNRPAVESGMVGRSLARDTKKQHASWNRSIRHQSSDISLPSAESLRSSCSSNSELRTAYRLSPLDTLSPRPTIRFEEAPRILQDWTAGSETKKRRINVPDDVLRSNKRVDDLADDLDAGELRQLMERDQKRRERREIKDRLKTERKLARRLEKQRREEAEAVRDGTPPPVNLDRGVMGREVADLGVGTSAIITSSKRKSSSASENGQYVQPSDAFEAGDASPVSPILPIPAQTVESELSDEVEDAPADTITEANISPDISPPSSPRGHQRGSSSISQMIDASQSEPEPVVLSQPPPFKKALVVPPNPSHGLKWPSFLRRASRSKRAATPSSFSNTSRDSMQSGLAPHALAPAPAPHAQPTYLGKFSQPTRTQSYGYTPVRQASNLPKRTMSKFREDLPELPISPPDSRVHSPEADVLPPIRTDFPERRVGPAMPVTDRYDTPNSGNRSEVPSPDPVALSQSLASIDSEGSWLSGGLGTSKRGSSQSKQSKMTAQAHRESVGSSMQRRYPEYSESNEELGITEDEYFSRLSPDPTDPEHNIRLSVGAPVPSSDEDEGGSLASPVTSEKWGAVGRRPTVVHADAQTKKSSEGLLNQYDATEEMANPPHPHRSSLQSQKASEILDEGYSGKGRILRARSVDLTKHTRHISAGSAKLFDVKPRASGEGSRRPSMAE